MCLPGWIVCPLCSSSSFSFEERDSRPRWRAGERWRRKRRRKGGEKGERRMRLKYNWLLRGRWATTAIEFNHELMNISLVDCTASCVLARISIEIVCCASARPWSTVRESDELFMLLPLVKLREARNQPFTVCDWTGSTRRSSSQPGLLSSPRTIEIVVPYTDTERQAPFSLQPTIFSLIKSTIVFVLSSCRHSKMFVV